MLTLPTTPAPPSPGAAFRRAVRIMPTLPPLVFGRGESTIAAPSLRGKGTVTPWVTGSGGVRVAVPALQGAATLVFGGVGRVSVGRAATSGTATYSVPPGWDDWLITGIEDDSEEALLLVPV